MKKFLFAVSVLLLAVMFAASSEAAYPFKEDSFNTSLGELKIGFIGRASLMFSLNDKVIYVDPNSKMTSYSSLPKADAIVITHEHPDHCDPSAVGYAAKNDTEIILNNGSQKVLKKGNVLKHGETMEVFGVKIEAVQAYDASPTDNGYVFDFGNLRIYVSGDTRVFSGAQKLKNIDIAFIGSYHTNPETVARVVSRIKPKFFYPYHTSASHTKKLIELLKDSGVEIRDRNMSQGVL